MNRRSCLQFFLSAPFAAVAALASRDALLDFDLTPYAPEDAAQDLYRTRYRANATVLVLGIPVLAREEVGGGEAELLRWRETHNQATMIRFTAGSDPKRAGGLNRVGAFEERILESHGAMRQAAYFGFMTASPEEDEDSGREALKKPRGETANFQAISGDIEPARAVSLRCDVELASNLTWRTAGAIRKQIRAALRSHPLKETRQALDQAQGTFLHSLLKAAWSRQTSVDANYLYNGRQYRLKTQRKADPAQGRKLAKKALVADASQVEKLEGTITRLDTGSKTHFKLWMDGGAEDLLPVRFEYKPKGFLRVAFEKESLAARAIREG